MQHQLSTSTASVLYWPGMRRSPSEFATLWQGLSGAGFAVSWVDVPYDCGPPPDSPISAVARWLAQRPLAEWWIGLSLGASVAHVAAATAAAGRCPRRLTLINPIADRVKLAEERGFSLEGRWPLLAEQFPVFGVAAVDLILSTHDMRVPPEQGRSLVKCYPASSVRVVEVATGHAFEDVAIQRSLLSSLLTGDADALSPQNPAEVG
jgi:hypothetical protein